MHENSNLVVTAWNDDTLVGVARALTDYLSDLAVHEGYQGKGIGKTLMQQVKEQVGDQSMLLLISAEGAKAFYQK